MPTTIRCWTSSRSTPRPSRTASPAATRGCGSMTCPTSSPSAATAPSTWSMSTAASLLCSRIPPARRPPPPLRAFFGEMTAQAAPPQVLPAGAAEQQGQSGPAAGHQQRHALSAGLRAGPAGHRQDQHHRKHADDGVFQRAHGAFFQLQQPSHRRRCGKAAGRHLPRPDRAVPDPAPWQQRENRRGPAHHRPAV